MKFKKKKRLRKFNIHPVTVIFLMMIFTILLSFILSKLGVGASYKVVNPYTYELETKTFYIKNMLSFSGFKYLITNSFTNLQSFKPLATLLIVLVGLSVAHASGLINSFIRRVTSKIDNRFLTFIIIFLGITGTIINDAIYVILIPLSALIFLANKRSPILGIVTAFCGTAFGYGTALFVGTVELKLTKMTHLATYVGDKTESIHIALLSNIYIMIPAAIVIALIGTYIIESLMVKIIGRYKVNDEILSLTKEVDVEAIQEAAREEKENIKLELNDRRGLIKATIAAFIVIAIFIYMIIPDLPLSGMLLDKNESSYVNQLFGTSSHFQDGFTVMMMLLFMITGIVYGISSKSIKSDKELFNKIAIYLKDVGIIVFSIFIYTLFIYIFNESNIGLVLTCWGVKLLEILNFKGAALVIVSMFIIALTGFFEPSMYTKWSLFSPVMVPLFMKSNILPQFAQFTFRAADSITKGITPFMSYFIIYLIYLNLYNTEEEPISIKKAMSYVRPYFLAIGVTWILFILLFFILNLPIGPGVRAII